MKKFDILPPEDSDLYPMTILWIEDRRGHEIRKGDTIALLRTPLGDRPMKASDDSRLAAVLRRKGDTLRKREALLSVLEPGQGAGTTPAARTMRNLVANRIAPMMFGGLAVFLLLQKGPDLYSKVLALAQEAGEANEIIETSKTGAPSAASAKYDGPYSYETMKDRELFDEKGSGVTSSAGALSAGEGHLVFQHPYADSTITCGAALIGDNAAIFSRRCINSIIHSGVAIEGEAYFQYARKNEHSLAYLFFPVRSVRYWHPGEEDASSSDFAVAVLDPVSGKTAASVAGKAGFTRLSIGGENPPPYLHLELQNLDMDNMLRKHMRCRYWLDDEQATAARKNRDMALKVTVARCPAGSSQGIVRVPRNGNLLAAGFYRSSIPENGGGILMNSKVETDLFAAYDYERLSLLRKGDLPEGGGEIIFDLKDRSPAIMLNNACNAKVDFNFMDESSGESFSISVQPNERDWFTADEEGLSGNFLFSIGEGDASSPDAVRKTIDGKTHHMYRERVPQGMIFLTADAC